MENEITFSADPELEVLLEEALTHNTSDNATIYAPPPVSPTTTLKNGITVEIHEHTPLLRYEPRSTPSNAKTGWRSPNVSDILHMQGVGTSKMEY